jgi:phenylalanyl-tRNA synthetase beta chain
VSASDAIEALGRLGISAENADGEVRVEVPSFRVDLVGEIDLVEEVARVQGYDTLASTVPGIRRSGGFEPAHALRRRVREVLLRAGLREATSLSFASQSDLDLMGHDDGVRVTNPPSTDEPFLRSSLIPNLLRALSRNADRGRPGAALFEIGHVFRPAPSGEVDERESVAAVLWGPAGDGVHAERRPLDFFDGKGAVETLMQGLGIADWAVAPDAGRPFHPGRSARVLVGDTLAGVVGELHPGVAEQSRLSGRVTGVELDVATLASSMSGTRFSEVPRFPPVHRDLAFVVDAATPAGEVRSALIRAAGELLDTAVLFDVFEGLPLPAGKKTLAFSVDFRAPDRTLTDAEAEAVVQEIVRRLAQEFGAEFRAG